MAQQRSANSPLLEIAESATHNDGRMRHAYATHVTRLPSAWLMVSVQLRALAPLSVPATDAAATAPASVPTAAVTMHLHYTYDNAG